MSQGRPETEADAEPMDSREARDRFEALADKIRQESHLPPQGDQSWREREAMRRAAYDRGYTPPQGDQSWREQESLRFVPLQEEDTAQAPVNWGREPREPVPLSVPTTRGGHGGIVLALLLVAAIALGITVLANPDILTAGYWRAHQDETTATAKPQSAPAEVAPVAPAAPVAQPAPPPPPAPASDLRGTPDPAPPAKVAPPPPAPKPPVQIIDAAAPPKPARAAPRDEGGTGGFYAKVPGPDGTLQNKFFPSEVKPDQAKSGQVKLGKEPAVAPLAGGRRAVDRGAVDERAGGFYARVPGPDGTLEYKYFPSKPPR